MWFGILAVGFKLQGFSARQVHSYPFTAGGKTPTVHNSDPNLYGSDHETMVCMLQQAVGIPESSKRFTISALKDSIEE